MKSYKFIITGKIQGVYYRANIKKNAQTLGCKGYVKNLSNGTVEAAVTCEESDIEKFVHILQEGSPLSKVESIQQLECSEIFNKQFTVR